MQLILVKFKFTSPKIKLPRFVYVLILTSYSGSQSQTVVCATLAADVIYGGWPGYKPSIFRSLYYYIDECSVFCLIFSREESKKDI